MKINVLSAVSFSLQFFLGAVFIYAGAVKIGSPRDFADSIASYQIVPDAMISLTALGLPFFEIMCGSLVLIRRFSGIGLIGIFLMLITFTAAFTASVVRGLSVHCGCFGSNALLDASPTVSVVRDLLLLAITGFLYRRHLLWAGLVCSTNRNLARFP